MESEISVDPVPPTAAELAALPEPLRQAIDVVYQHLGLEPTCIINPDKVLDKSKVGVYFTMALYIGHSLPTGSRLEFCLEGCIRKLLEIDEIRDSGLMQAVADYLQDVRPPASPVATYLSHNLANAIKYTLIRRWETARWCVGRWLDSKIADVAHNRLTQVYRAYIDQHEQKCQSLGLTDPLTADYSTTDTSDYEMGRGGNVCRYDFTLTREPRGDGGVLSLVVETEDEDGRGSEFNTKEGALGYLADRIEELESELRSLRYIHRASQSEDVEYDFAGQDDLDPEDPDDLGENDDDEDE